jgi:hypothetical protein
MPRPKKVPTAFAVVSTPKATKLVSAQGKLDLMTRAREKTDGGEKILNFLVRVLDGDGSTSQGLEASKILLAYGWGKPIETQVTADVSPTDKPGSVAMLTADQLEAVVSGSVVEQKTLAPADVTEAEDVEKDGEH